MSNAATIRSLLLATVCALRLASQSAGFGSHKGHSLQKGSARALEAVSKCGVERAGGRRTPGSSPTHRRDAETGDEGRDRRDDAGAPGRTGYQWQPAPDFRYSSSSQQEGEGRRCGDGWGDYGVGDKVIVGKDEAPYDKARIAQVELHTNIMMVDKPAGGPEAFVTWAKNLTIRRTYIKAGVGDLGHGGRGNAPASGVYQPAHEPVDPEERVVLPGRRRDMRHTGP